MVSSQPIIIVAPWGNPFRWSPANYRLVGEEVLVYDKNTSLACLTHALKPDKVIPIIPEILLYQIPRKRKYRDLEIMARS